MIVVGENRLQDPAYGQLFFCFFALSLCERHLSKDHKKPLMPVAQLLNGAGTDLNRFDNAQLALNIFEFTASETTLLGDVNLDGVVDFFDIAPFITLLSTQSFQAEADINLDLAVNFFDIAPLIDILDGQ